MFWVIGIGGVVMLLLGGFGAWQKHRADNAVEQREAVQVQLDVCKNANADLTTQFEGLQASFHTFEKMTTSAQARAAKALADAKARERADEAEIVTLRGILEQPPSPDPIADISARAAAILRSAITDALGIPAR